jgi:glycosidase
MSEYKLPDKLLSLKDIDFDALTKREYHPSPAAWEDLVLYFLLLDRFSNGDERGGYKDPAGKPVNSGSIPQFDVVQDKGNATATVADAQKWWEAGNRWLGGTLNGVRGKLGYLKRLGVSAIWISPIFKQVKFQDSYHGYGIQDFLDVDPHFGTRDDLKNLVAEAHALGIYIILDVIMNHTGDVFEYEPDPSRAWSWGKDANGQPAFDPVWDGGEYKVKGFRDATGAATIPFGPADLAAHPGAWPDGAIWPAEFQHPEIFTRKGRIRNWDFCPEYLEGDFFSLKDIHLGDTAAEDDYTPSRALVALCEALKFWIAYADVDGFRLDTVKHMDFGAVRYFASVMDEFTQGLGKENFYLIGEITGGREFAFNKMQTEGLDAALGIDEIPNDLEYMVKGWSEPLRYFELFRNIKDLKHATHTWFKNCVVTMFDDHDQVGCDPKKRFCADPDAWRVVVNAVALNSLSLGIPCIYYGTEQGFNGVGGDERAMREAMFGGAFGSFQSSGRHFFNEENWIFKSISEVLAIRAAEISLRRGRQYLRMISGNGVNFDFPRRLGDGRIDTVIAWSRLFQNRPEILIAINTNYYEWTEAWVTVDAGQHEPGDVMKCIYALQPPDTERAEPARPDLKPVTVAALNGKSVRLRIPPAGLVIYK